MTRVYHYSGLRTTLYAMKRTHWGEQGRGAANGRHESEQHVGHQLANAGNDVIWGMEKCVETAE